MLNGVVKLFGHVGKTEGTIVFGPKTTTNASPFIGPLFYAHASPAQNCSSGNDFSYASTRSVF